MSHHTLVTFLGRGRSLPNDQIGYQTTKYSFLDDNGEPEPDQGEPEDTSFLGLVLVEHVKPDRFVILGTAGSQWSVLVEGLASTGEDQNARDELFEAEDREAVTQDRTYANCVNVGHLDAKSSNFDVFNPLNPPYQGDFKRKCVSPNRICFPKLRD